MVYYKTKSLISFNMEFKIIEEEVVYDGVFKVVKAHLWHESFNSGEKVECDREVFERGDSVAVVIYERDSDSILFTNQFRYATTKSDNGWILEILAGSLKENEDPVECAKREVLEELGYSVMTFEFVSTFYSSPGGSSERVYLYYCEVNQEDKIETGGGVEGEKEDIELIKKPMQDLGELLKSGLIKDAKSIIGLQWLQMRSLSKD